MVESALYNLLAANAGVAGLVSTRIFPNILRQEETLPAIAYQKIMASRPLVQSGSTSRCESTFQIDCFGDTPVAAKGLAAAVVSALHGVHGAGTSSDILLAQVVNELDLSDPSVGEFRVVIDIQLTHKE